MQDTLHFPYQSKLGEFEEFTARAKLPALALAPSTASAAAAPSSSQSLPSQQHSQQQQSQQQHAVWPPSTAAPGSSQVNPLVHARLHRPREGLGWMRPRSRHPVLVADLVVMKATSSSADRRCLFSWHVMLNRSIGHMLTNTPVIHSNAVPQPDRAFRVDLHLTIIP